MPLLNKQKFVKEPIPPNLDPEQEIFYSKLTQEIFIDYDEYFERTILCNSLVWTCALTGKSGLTFGEAVESETKARKVLSTFPQNIERAIVFLVSLSKRGNIKDLLDDIFSYIKDRFFLDETVQLVNQNNSKTDANKTHKIVDIIIPGSSNQLSKSLSKQKVDDDLMDVTIESESPSTNKNVEIDPSKIKYVIETSSTLTPNTTRQTVKAFQITRAKNLVTKDKTYMIIKKNCEVLNQSVWTLTESAMNRFNVSQMKFSDIFRGEPPLFEHTFGRGQFSRANLSKNGSPKQQQLSFDKSSGKLVSVNNNGDLNTSQSSKKKSQLNDSKNAKSSSSNKKSLTSPSKSNNNSKANPSKTSPKSSSKAAAKASSQPKNVVNKKTSEINQLAEKKAKIMKKKIFDMDDEEFLLWRQYATFEDLKESNLIELEFEKLEKREEKEKEKERLKNEKCKQKEYLKELKNPKEDLELENLVELPKPQPIKSKITQDMFGDAVMILEFLNYFGDLFEIKDDFPNGFNYDLLENALFSKSCDSALCNLLLFYLDSIFKCYDEETFEDGNVDSDNESNDVDFNESDEEDVSLDQLYKEPIKSVNDRESIASLAENYAKLIKSIQGRSLKNIGLDVYTISEMLRLYFITSGSSHYSKTKFWYQQRGGYTRMDEAGIDFALNEKPIIKKLEHMNVYELEPSEKLKILACLCHQLMSQVRFRDLLEDNWQKLTTSKAHLRDLQTEENRRIREETSERWKKKMEDKAKEKARLEELKSNPEQTNTNERISIGNDASALNTTDKQSIESDKKRQEFLKKEKAILEEIHQLQLKCSMIPIGRDRFYRRYWVFKSLPGLFVEDDEYYICENESQSFVKTDVKTETEPSESKTSVKIEDESESAKSENDFKENKPIISENQMDCNDINNQKNEMGRTKWCFYYLTDSIDQLINSLSERGLRESELKQNVVDSKEKIVDSLNKFYNQSIIKNLTMSQEEIEKGILNCLKENVSNVLANSSLQNMNGTSNCKTKRQTAKLIASTISILNPNPEISSHEFMEMDLRDKLMEIEEQIYIGALGSIRVNDRNKWKEALEKNCYDPQCTNLTWAGGEFVRPALEVNKQTEFESSNVLNLAKALLQIEQSVEKRFLRLPLGDSQKTPEKKKSKSKQANGDDSSENGDKTTNENKYAVLYSWEKSLMNCTSLSQVFIHLQTLDESIAWSKSALNARCRLCKRKGDAEKMLLCDKCDRGHHIYCLRPPLKTIPDGEWFCPECKPKDNEKAQRKMRKSFGNENGNEEICLDENANDETANSEDSNDEEDDDEENEVENDEEEEADEESGTECEEEENEEVNEEDNEEENDQEDAESLNEVNSDHSHNTDRSNDSQEKNPKRGIKIVPKNKLKLNGKHLNNENAQNSTNESNHSDEEMVNISSDDTENTKRVTRKRKADTIQDKKPLNNSKSQKTNGQTNTLKGKSVNSKSTSSLKDTSTSSKENNKSTTNRSFRNKKNPDYNELSDDISGTGTDEDTFYKNPKRNKTSKASSNVLNDFQMNNTNSRNTEMANRLKVIEKLLNDMMKQKDSWPFLKPVSKREAPDYFEVIKKPMDFATIKNNINNFKYADYTHIIDDIRLVFENCREYNEPKSDIYETGERLSSYFERHAKQAGLLDTKQLALNYH